MTVVDPSPQQSRPPAADVPEDEPVRLLAPDGTRRADERWDGWLLDVDDAALRALHRDLVLARRLDDVATALQRQGELGLWSPSRGQEAAQVGAGRALEEQDWAFPSYREHALALVRGVDPAAVLGLFRGTTLGGWDPADHRFGLYTIVVGSQALHAVGWAMGVRLDGEDAAVLACFGDGATSQGDVHEACVWAASYEAPVVLLCQNNQWAISEPLERQTRVPLARRAVGYGMPGVRVDGDDVLAVLAVCRAALAPARAGQGPTFVEAVTYRAGPHTTSDDPSRYRDPAEERDCRGARPAGPQRAAPARLRRRRRRVLRRSRRRGRRAGRRPAPARPGRWATRRWSGWASTCWRRPPTAAPPTRSCAARWPGTSPTWATTPTRAEEGR